MGAFDTAWQNLPAGATPGAGDVPISAAYLTAVDTQLRSERSDRVADGLVTKLDQASGSAVIVVFGDSTGAPGGTGDWVIDLAPLLGAKWLTHKVTMRNWGGSSYGSPTTVANASAALTLDIYNGSVGGTKTDYPVSRAAAMLPVRPDLIIINYGHNHAADTPATLQAGHDTLVSAARAVWADVPVAITSQNPRFSPAGNIAEHAARETAKRAWTATREYGYIPAWEAFQAQATPSAWVQSDGIHPTISGATDGSSLWASVVSSYLAGRTKRPAAAGSSLAVQDHGSTVSSAVSQIDFQGAGVAVAAGDPGKVTVTIPGATGSGSGGGSRDYRWFVPVGATSLDEFNDDTLDPSWVRVDGTGAPPANATWSEKGDSLSLYQGGGDGANVIRGLMRPLADVGGAVAPGDAFVTALRLFGPQANFTMGGIVLSDGVAHGSGAQAAALCYLTGAQGQSTFNAWSGTNWSMSGSTTDTTAIGTHLFLRFVCLTASTWRTDASPDGVSWLRGASVLTRAITPTHVGLVSSSWGTSTKGIVTYEFLRRVSGVA